MDGAGGHPDSAYGLKADVWSYGCVVAEVTDQGKPPWPPFANAWAALMHIGNPDVAPVVPAHMEPAAQAILRRCWERDVGRRPTAAQLLREPYLSDPEAAELDSSHPTLDTMYLTMDRTEAGTEMRKDDGAQDGGKKQRNNEQRKNEEGGPEDSSPKRTAPAESAGRKGRRGKKKLGSADKASSGLGAQGKEAAETGEGALDGERKARRMKGKGTPGSLSGPARPVPPAPPSATAPAAPQKLGDARIAE